MLNISGAEVLVILVVALLVLGPEKLPETLRKAGRVMGEVRRMSSGFQSEMRQALGEDPKPTFHPRSDPVAPTDAESHGDATVSSLALPPADPADVTAVDPAGTRPSAPDDPTPLDEPGGDVEADLVTGTAGAAAPEAAPLGTGPGDAVHHGATAANGDRAEDDDAAPPTSATNGTSPPAAPRKVFEELVELEVAPPPDPAAADRGARDPSGA